MEKPAQMWVDWNIVSAILPSVLIQRNRWNLMVPRQPADKSINIPTVWTAAAKLDHSQPISRLTKKTSSQLIYDNRWNPIRYLIGRAAPDWRGLIAWSLRFTWLPDYLFGSGKSVETETPAMVKTPQENPNQFERKERYSSDKTFPTPSAYLSISYENVLPMNCSASRNDEAIPLWAPGSGHDAGAGSADGGWLSRDQRLLFHPLSSLLSATGNEPVECLVSLNLHRRMSVAQREMMAVPVWFFAVDSERGLVPTLISSQLSQLIPCLSQSDGHIFTALESYETGAQSIDRQSNW